MKTILIIFILALITPFAGYCQWDQIGQTLFGDQQEGYLGDEVSMSDDGSTIAVASASYSSNGLTYNGKVQVYRLVNNVWTQLGPDLVGNENGETLGNSLSLNENGTILAIGSEYGNGSNGKVSVLSYAENEWNLVGPVITGEFNNGRFGADVSLSNDGQTVAIARFGFNGSFGSHIYEFDGNVWLNTAGGSSTDNVRSITISADGNRVIYAGQEWLHITDKVDGSWTTPTNNLLVGDDGTNGGSSFLSMSGDGTVFAKGAEFNDDGGINAGVVVIVNRTDPDAWTFDYVYGSNFDKLGRSVSLNHDGTKFSVLGGLPRIYEFIDGEWTLTYTILESANSNALSADGSILVTGYVEYSTPELEFVGLIKVFGGLPNESPSLSCPSELTVDADPGMCSATVTLDDLIANDLEDGDILAVQTDGIESGEAFPLGSSTVTFTATDSGGLSASCSYTIAVVDNESPTVLCNSLTVYLDDFGVASVSAEEVDGGSFDNCGIALMEINQAEFSCENLGENNLELTVTDVNGNAEICSTNVIVLDVISPVITCQNLDLNLNDEGMASIADSEFVLSQSDNCGIEISDIIYEFNCENAGINELTYEVFDLSGNSSTCTVEINVLDAITPTMLCQNSSVALDENGEASLSINDVDDDSIDNCELTMSLDVQSFSCSDIGVNTVVLTGLDATGNTATCMAEITVVDDLNPEIICPEDQLDYQEVDVAFELPNYMDLLTTTDNCDDESIVVTQNPLSGSVLEAGDHLISFSAIDENGNEATCSFNLTIELADNINENTVPTIEFYPNPAGDVIYLKGHQNSPVKVEIYNLVGQLLISLDGVINESVDISEISSGEYLIQLLQEGSVLTRRLIVID